jgi:Alg9-like mannosyltransferase family
LFRRHWVFALAGAVFVLQLVLAHVYCGFLTGDEVEPLSEALRVATDYKYEPWDARNTFVARFFLAPFLWIATQLGVTSRAALVVIATIPCALAAALTIVFVHRLALRWTADQLASSAATLLFALHWLPLGFGSTTYPRVIAMAFIAGAALLVARRRDAAGPAAETAALLERRRPAGWLGTVPAPLFAGALMGVAFADRYSEAIYLFPLLIAARRRFWQVGLGAVLSICITSGIYEWWLWGTPFHNLITWTKLTILEGKISARATTQPPYWFLTNLPRWCAPTMLPFLWYARKREPWLFFILPLAALTLISHKELRFLQSIIPFLAILGGIGFACIFRVRRNLATALLVVSLAWNLWGLRFLGKETKPAVEAARFLGAQNYETIALGQIWAYGDRIYLDNEVRLIDVGTPIHSLDIALPAADAIAVFESDITPEVANAFAKHGYKEVRTFRAPRARDVVVFTASGSAR